MTIADIIQIFTDFFSNQDFISKIVLLTLLTLYTLFSIIITRQIYIMNTIVNQFDFSPLFRILALMNTVFAIAILLFVILLV